LKADDYAGTATESIKKMQAQVGDLCFTSDGIARRGVLLRHFVMPGEEDEGQELMRWLGREVSKDIFVDIMEQYHADAYVGTSSRSTKANLMPDPSTAATAIEPGGEEAKSALRYSEINRPVSAQAAEAAGIWRFCDPARLQGFNM